MKSKLLLMTFLIFILFSGCGIHESNEDNDVNTSDTLSTQQNLGVDEYGMKQYVMAFLKTGPNREHDSIEAASIQRAHLDNIKRLAEDGSLVLAGPFLDSGEIRGIYIFNVETIQEAEQLTATDPAIKAGRLEMELHPWYGSAALMQVNKLHKKLARKEI